MLNNKTIKAVGVLKILSSKTRFKIISELLKKEEGLCVKELAEAVGISQSAVSHQLARLEDKEIVSSCRIGQMICYCVKKTALTKSIAEIISYFNKL
ncbi:MAG: ArsR/SmtB family transcription factor [Candidatus Paceibacteria bacterium]